MQVDWSKGNADSSIYRTSSGESQNVTRFKQIELKKIEILIFFKFFKFILIFEIRCITHLQMLLSIILYYCIWWSSLNFMISATTAGMCKILSHVYSICILWILAQTDFSKRWEISVKTCRLPLPWLHTDLFHLGQLHFHAGSGHWVLLHEWN